jgi:arylamine N-acetyltransferase
MSLPLAAILRHLELGPAPADLNFLNRLLFAWSEHVPWESASRIARHLQPAPPESLARWPEEFFENMLRLGTGGTCFESNGALKVLLEMLGYDLSIVFCDMETDTQDPHCALVVQTQHRMYLADVGYPIPFALPLDARTPSAVETAVYRYEATPIAPDRWEVRRISGEYDGLCFWVKAEPVSESSFRARVLRDHTDHGQFLNEVILHRLDGEQVWYYSEHRGLVRRTHGREDPLYFSDIARANMEGVLAHFFGVNPAVIRAALTRIPMAGVWG